MKTIDELRTGADLDVLCAEIEERRDLANNMLGNLYPVMLADEIVDIIDMINARSPGYFQTRMNPGIHPKKNP